MLTSRKEKNTTLFLFLTSMPKYLGLGPWAAISLVLLRLVSFRGWPQFQTCRLLHLRFSVLALWAKTHSCRGDSMPAHSNCFVYPLQGRWAQVGHGDAICAFAHELHELIWVVSCNWYGRLRNWPFWKILETFENVDLHPTPLPGGRWRAAGWGASPKKTPCAIITCFIFWFFTCLLHFHTMKLTILQRTQEGS